MRALRRAACSAHIARRSLPRPADRGRAAHAAGRRGRAAGTTRCRAPTGGRRSSRPASRSCTSSGPASPGRPPTWRATSPTPRPAIFADAGHALFVDDAPRFNALMRRASSAAGSGREPAHVRCWPLFLVSAAAVGLRDRADPLLRRREMVGVWLLGDLHRHGRVRAQRRRRGAGARRAGPARRRRCCAGCPLLLIVAGGAGLLGDHRQPVQPAATAEPGDLAAAARQHRAVLRRPAAVLLPGRPVHQPELRAERATGSAWSTASI